MAIIQIQAGGRPMTVDVPDFAMESTQQDIRSIMSDMQSSLTGMRTAIGASSQGDQQIAQAIQRGNDQDRKYQMGQSVRDSKLAKGIGNATAMGMTQSLAKPGMVTNLMKSLGLGSMATAFGMVMGVSKELSSAFSFAGSVGVTFGGDIVKTSEELAKVGLQLDQFGDLIAQNTNMMFELGGSVEAGSQKFIDLLQDMEKSSSQFGYFGLAADEMAQFMAEELEIRRKSMDAEQLRLYIQNDLNDAMMRNFLEQEKMAKITGQNVRERIRAQMAAKEDTFMQAAMATMTPQQLESVNAVFSNLGFDGPIADELRKAMIQEIASPGMGLVGNNAGQLMAMDQSGELRRLFEQGVGGVRRGDNMVDINNTMGETLQRFRQSGAGQRGNLVNLGIAGNKEATQLLQLLQSLNEIEGSHLENRKKYETESAKQDQRDTDIMRKLTFRLNVQEATQANLALRTIMKIGGIDATGMLEGITDFVDGMTDTFTNKKVQGLFEAFGTIIGLTTVQPLFNAVGGNASGIEFAYLAGLLGQAGGLPGMVTGPLMFPQQAVAAGSGANQFMMTAYPDYVTEIDDPDGPPGTKKKVFDYNSFISDKGTGIINGTPTFFTEMTKAFKNAFNGINPANITPE
tara:strand:+ start:1189 stop:3072 length:1884 start_codon:yes stop_codon:yes gene_type:complete